jgi:hypothetical protein
MSPEALARWFGLNARALNESQCLSVGTLNVIFAWLMQKRYIQYEICKV